MTNYTYINYPIPDRSVPTNITSFCQLIIKTCKIIRELKKGERIYINCRGGHGRSGLLVACILCYIFNLIPYDALLYTNKCHSNRHVMKEKWRKIGSPQTYLQKKFVYKLFQPINLNKIYKNSIYSHPIEIKNIGSFINVFHAFNYYKEIYESDPSNSIFDSFELKSSWIELRDNIMNFIIRTSIENNNEFRENLMNSNLRPIIAHLEGDNLWGIGKDNSGENRVGKILNNLRKEYFLQN